MLRELGIFLVLWLIQLFVFACIGNILFIEVKGYENFWYVMIIFFQQSLGVFNFSDFSQMTLINPYFAQVFQLFQIVLNMILFVNLVIAILSETYIRLSEQKLGLFYDGVIEVIHAYKYKKYYGALIAAGPPFNLLVFPFLPLFIWGPKKKKLRCLNNTLASLIFLPFALLYAAFFAFCNLVLAPVAYVANVFRNFK